MSRTYRRKKAIVFDITWVLEGTSIDRYSKEGKKLIALYHTDRLTTMNQVPKWYKVQFIRRPFRAKEKQELILAIKYLGEDITFPIPKMCKNYYW